MCKLDEMIQSWPIQDQLLWQRAVLPPETVLDSGGWAADWRFATARLGVGSYHRFVTWLRDKGLLIDHLPPEQRISKPVIREYVQYLRSCKFADWTVYTELHHLSNLLRALTNGLHPLWLVQIANRIGRNAKAVCPKAPRIVHSSRLYDLGIKLMAPVRAMTHLTRNAAVQYRDGLSIAMRAMCPLRSGEHLALRIGDNFRPVGERYVGWLEGHLTKSKRSAEAFYPPSLTAWIAHYIDVIRPFLTRGNPTGDWLWIAYGGRRMLKDASRISRITKKEFQRRVNPHLFRDCAVTSTALDAPEKIGIMPAVLNHSTDRPAEAFYNQATMLSAVGRHADVIRKLQQ